MGSVKLLFFLTIILLRSLLGDSLFPHQLCLPFIHVLFPFLSPTHYLLEIDTYTFSSERERRKEGKDPCGCFSLFFFLFCHPPAALPFAFLLGSMSKGNIESYSPLQPTESKKCIILMSGERVWVIAYHRYLELQIKNLRMGKPSCSFPHACSCKK